MPFFPLLVNPINRLALGADSRWYRSSSTPATFENTDCYDMVSQRDLEERLRAVDAQLQVEDLDWKDEERKLYELEDAYLRDSTVHGNLLTGWGDAKTASIRFRNAALRRKKRERQQVEVSLSAEEQLKVDKHRFASFSSLTSPAEPLLATLDEREKKMETKAPAAATVTGVSTKEQPSHAKRARK